MVTYASAFLKWQFPVCLLFDNCPTESSWSLKLLSEASQLMPFSVDIIFRKRCDENGALRKETDMVIREMYAQCLYIYIVGKKLMFG